jgi:hypothetical protein
MRAVMGLEAALAFVGRAWRYPGGCARVCAGMPGRAFYLLRRGVRAWTVVRVPGGSLRERVRPRAIDDFAAQLRTAFTVFTPLTPTAQAVQVA